MDDLDKFGLYENGNKVTDKPEILFARLDAKEIMPKIDAIREAQKAEFEAEQKTLGELPETTEESGEAIDIEANRRSNMMIYENAVPGRRDHFL